MELHGEEEEEGGRWPSRRQARGAGPRPRRNKGGRGSGGRGGATETRAVCCIHFLLIRCGAESHCQWHFISFREDSMRHLVAGETKLLVVVTS